MTGETRTEVQVRLVLEAQARELAGQLEAALPAGVGFCLMLGDIGEEGGNNAYVANIDRASAISMLEATLELLRKAT